MAYQGDAWTALGDPTRKAIFELLADRPRAVGELAGELPVSRPAVSQHLKVLKDAGLVVDQPVGTRRVYRVEPCPYIVIKPHLPSKRSDCCYGEMPNASVSEPTGLNL